MIFIKVGMVFVILIVVASLLSRWIADYFGGID